MRLKTLNLRKSAALMAAVLGGALALAVSPAEARSALQIIHSFAGGSSDGAGPFGGVTPAEGSDGCGTAYQYFPVSGAYQQLAAFHCDPDAAFPFAGLAASSFYGVLFGISYNGGSGDDGELFDIYPDGSVRNDCSIGQNIGNHPFAAVTLVGDGVYIQTTTGGAHNVGTLSLLEPSCNGEVLHDFAGGDDGAAPYGTLVQYGDYLYGTTSSGGTGTNLGTVFRVGLEGGGYQVMHVFQGICCGSDGSFPHAGLAFNKKDGMLYGTTINGGNSSDNGTVYKIDPNTGAETVVYSFSGGDGAHPYGDLYIKGSWIYGTTLQGGANDLGEVFKLKM
ncbi:MAG TPA: choice-of-anchor tandem repeat GloVer-containing protein [Rhizomicrobium sp.]|nr:choice-of-anchor tandem repeat GloVer-containing protein [Rhizomicrobium sp.]